MALVLGSTPLSLASCSGTKKAQTNDIHAPLEIAHSDGNAIQKPMRRAGKPVSKRTSEKAVLKSLYCMAKNGFLRREMTPDFNPASSPPLNMVLGYLRFLSQWNSLLCKSGCDRATARIVVQHNSADHQPEIASQDQKKSLLLTMRWKILK